MEFEKISPAYFENSKDNYKTNLKAVIFLDVTLNLSIGTYQPYNKPNDSPLYINTKSNHPPNIIKSLPESISRRISNISSNKDIFDVAAPYYNNALSASGYNEGIEYKTNTTPSTRRRSTGPMAPPYGPMGPMAYGPMV